MQTNEPIIIPNLFANPKMTISDWNQSSINRRINLNLKVINSKIYTWSQLCTNKFNGRNLRNDLDYNLIFFHIYKTAGTTLSSIIAKNYRINAILHINPSVLDNNIYCLFKLKRCMRVILGHYELNDIIYQFIDRNKLVHLTLLRNPIERVISYYDHIISRERHKLHSLVRSMSLQNFVNSDLVNDVNNGQSLRVLGLIKSNSYLSDTRTDAELLTDAKKTIKNNFSIVGTTDEFNLFLIMCNKLLGWDDIYYKNKNTSKQKTNIHNVDQKVIDSILFKNQIDSQLYEYVKELIEERKNLLEISDDSMQNFHIRNNQYKNLLNH